MVTSIVAITVKLPTVIPVVMTIEADQTYQATIFATRMTQLQEEDFAEANDDVAAGPKVQTQVAYKMTVIIIQSND
jgi:phosphoribosylcarboxyaminoimidazole (NCAIR) mutase